MKKLNLVATCVTTPMSEVSFLEEMCEKAKEIACSTFKKYVDVSDIRANFGYVSGRNAQGLRLEKDWAVKFFKSTWKGAPCVYMQHSCIEYIYQ